MSLQSDTTKSGPAPPTPEGVLEYRGAAPGAAENMRVRGGDILASGFGMTVAVWIVAYVSRMPVVNAPGEATVAGMLLMVLVGGFMAARYSRKGIRAAVLAGALSGLLDILIVGSLIHDYMKAHTEGAVPSAALWVGGSVLLNALVAGLGGIVGHLLPSGRRDRVQWVQVFALVLAAATLPLITAGGLVTAFRAGLAVPDWPQSYGYNMFLFPLSMMQKNEGNFYEHAHRLMGTLAGLTSLVAAIYITVAERRRWIQVLAWSIFGAICVQGILGGTRVTEKSIALAISHGVFAQIVFAAMAALAAAAGRNFLQLPRTLRPEASTDRALTAGLVGAIVVQLILGALLRHTDSLLMVHISMATVVLLAALACGIRAWGLNASLRPLVKSGIAVLAIVAVQILLGIIALVFRAPAGDPQSVAGAFITTAHQANGALLLAASTVLMTWTWRLLSPGEVTAENHLTAPT
jgi:heme A synthase